MFIFLIGMPGSGKTYWLRPLADTLGFLPFDLDADIESLNGCRIADIFERHGEARFRELEKERLGSLLQQKEKNWVVATGGGTPCFGNNLQKMKAAGPVVYLKKDISGLAARLSGTASSRPLLGGSRDKTDMLQTLFVRRKDIYEQADLILDADKLTLPIFVGCLKSFLKF